MPITTDGGTAAQQQDVSNAANNVIANLGQITNDELRDCIRNKANNGTVEIEECDDAALLGWNTWIAVFGFKLWASGTIHVCINNHGNNAQLLRDTLMHEWAHSCCWDHGDGQGVPA